MIDLTCRSAEVDGQVVKYSVKADGKVEDAYIFEADVAFVIASVEDARIVEKVIPGAVEVFARAGREDDNWKFNTSVVPDIRGFRATISHAARGKVAMEGGCEIKALRLRSSKKATACTIKLAFGGQTAQGAANLAAMLRSACCLSLEHDQQVIPFARKAGEAPPAPAKGDIIVAVAGGDTYCGRFVEQAGSIITIEDFDNEYAVEVDEVTAVLKVGGDVAALSRSYKTRCGKRKIQPTWAAIVLAFAEGAEVRGTATIDLTAEVIERAVARLESGDADFLPPEAGGAVGAEA